MKATVVSPMSAMARLFIYVSTGQIFDPASRQAAHTRVRKAIPWMERTKGEVLRAFLDSPATVHDMMRSLGKRRPDDIYRMLFTFTKKEARTGYFIGRLEETLDFLMDVKAVPFSTVNKDAPYTLRLKVDAGLVENLTPDEDFVMVEILKDKMNFPTDFAMTMWEAERQRA